METQNNEELLLHEIRKEKWTPGVRHEHSVLNKWPSGSNYHHKEITN